MLDYKNHELEKMKQELSYPNYELYVVNELSAATSERLDIKEIQELTNNLLVREKPINAVLVEQIFPRKLFKKLKYKCLCRT